jgi:hypothetical protein
MLGRGHHENYKRSRVRNARKSSGRVTCRITTIADTKRWRSYSENARSADQSGRLKSDRRKISSASRTVYDAWSSKAQNRFDVGADVKSV